MILKLIQRSRTNHATYELDNPDLIVDPRPMFPVMEPNHDWKFKVAVEGTTLTVTRIDKDLGWRGYIHFRIYNRNEDFYSFESTKYLYHGIAGERAPHCSTEVVFKEGIERIEGSAFTSCESLRRITIPASILKIASNAFRYCTSLQSVKLPPDLKTISWCAFADCSSLQAIFIPQTVKVIGSRAFENCEALQMINIPRNITDLDAWGGSIISSTHPLLKNSAFKSNSNHQQINNWLKHRLNPFQNYCCTTDVTTQGIREHIQSNQNAEEVAIINDKHKMTALHLLVANPYMTSDSVLITYLNLVPHAATIRDSSGRTALHILCSLPCLPYSSGDMIRAYIQNAKGREAAFSKDSEGKTPFDHLCCRDSFDDVPFLEKGNKTVSGLMIWWHEAIGMNLFAGVPSLLLKD